MTAFATLRGLAAPKPQPREHCDLCGAPLMRRHQHLLDPAARRLICSCDACSLLFYRNGETKYKSVPRDARLLTAFQLTDAQWDSLLIPIGLAFFLESSAEHRVLAYYPSPAGSTESLLPLETWAGIIEQNPALAAMEADVEALLVNLLGETPEYYLAPIDRCYELVGLIRANWHGLSGGAPMREKIRGFFADLKENARA